MIDWAALEARNAALNAFVAWDRAAAPGSGPLTNLTIGVKANLMTRGLPWTGGMALYGDRIASRDADVVAQLRAGGAAILGSLNMHEAALGATTDNPFYGRTQNPHATGFTPGGSSGGSGAAVAAGLCDAALGTDTLGSVRIPAAYCGVYGLKPTHGAVSQDGLACLEPDFDVIGPLARNLEVLERVWNVIAPLSLRGEGQARSARVREATLLAAVPSPSLPAVAYPSPLQGESPVFVLSAIFESNIDPGVRRAYDRAQAHFGPAKAVTFENSLTDIRMAGLVAAGRYLIADLGTDRTAKADLISPQLHAILSICEKLDPRPDILARTRANLIDTLGDDGILIMPTAPQPAFAHDAQAPANQADFTCLASIAGLPALAIPAGVGDNGLPVGIQIVGPANSEARLIALARSLEPLLGGSIPLNNGD